MAELGVPPSFHHRRRSKLRPRQAGSLRKQASCRGPLVKSSAMGDEMQQRQKGWLDVRAGDQMESYDSLTDPAVRALHDGKVMRRHLRDAHQTDVNAQAELREKLVKRRNLHWRFSASSLQQAREFRTRSASAPPQLPAAAAALLQQGGGEGVLSEDEAPDETKTRVPGGQAVKGSLLLHLRDDREAQEAVRVAESVGRARVGWQAASDSLTAKGLELNNKVEVSLRRKVKVGERMVGTLECLIECLIEEQEKLEAEREVLCCALKYKEQEQELSCRRMELRCGHDETAACIEEEHEFLLSVTEDFRTKIRLVDAESERLATAQTTLSETLAAKRHALARDLKCMSLPFVHSPPWPTRLFHRRLPHGWSAADTPAEDGRPIFVNKF